jgi:hypothetical protein
MKVVFDVLHAVHPLLLAIYLVTFCAGMILPAVYCVVRQCPYSIGVIWRHAKKRDLFARIVIAVYGIFAFLSALVVLLVLLGKLLA